MVGTGWSSDPTTTIASKILSLWGMANAMGSAQTGTYTLSLSFTPPTSSAAIQGNFELIAKNSNGSWINAVDGNFGGTKNFVLGPWSSSATLGTYGLDTSTYTAWAVINFNGDFAVAGFDQVKLAPAPNQSISMRSNVYMKGNKMILPPKFADKGTVIEFFSLSGRLILRVVPKGNILDLSGLNKDFKNKEVVVKCISGTQLNVQKILVY
jgi:hypothetical protein